MVDVFLIYPTPEGSRQTAVEGERTTLGRGEVDVRFDDRSLSRVHASIYREGDRVWILDENSTNGTFVNGLDVSPSGTPLKNGDSVRLGNDTFFAVQIVEKKKESVGAAKKQNVGTQVQTNSSGGFNFIPFVIGGVAILLIGLSAIIIGSQIVNSGSPNNSNEIAAANDDPDNERPVNSDDEDNDNMTKPTPKPRTSATPENANTSPSPEIIESNTNQQPKVVVPDKTYKAMSEDEKRKFVEQEAMQVAQSIGNRASDQITPDAVTRIKDFLDGYAQRMRSARKDDCTAAGWVRSDMQTVLERAHKNAPFIVRSFNSEGISPLIGLYLAMIESEHCVCLQSPTGPLGMFQFTKATGATYGLEVKAGASPANPDQRCEPEPASHAAAKYMKFLTGRYGTGPRSVPLAIASYNSGEGGLSQNLATALENAEKQERSFWTLMLQAEKLSAQFQKENRKYVPKFFAAAIIGENPTVFGVNLPPLSSNTGK